MSENENSEIKTKKPDIWFKVFVAINIFFVVIFAYTNTQFAESKHYLHMDERVTFDGVKKILYPLDENVEYSFAGKVKKFIKEVYGSDHRYGRVHWYMSAVVSFIPEKIWSDTGIIISCRFYQLFLISFAYILLMVTFFKDYKSRSLCLLVLYLIPTTAYYIHMPKPEPFQLQCFSSFLYFLQKNNYKFGKYWFFLGLAFGAKISILFIIPALFFYCFKLQEKEQSKTVIKAFIPAILFFILGWMISEPLIFRGLFQPSSYLTFFQEIKNNSSHGSDLISINVFDWINYITVEYFSDNKVLIVLVLIFILVYLAVNFKDILLDKNNCVLFISFCLLFFPIVFLVNRLWGIYLHIPFVFLFILLIRIYVFKGTSNSKKGTYFFCFFVSIHICLTAYSQSHKISSLIYRESSQEHRKKNQEYKTILILAEELSKRLGRPITSYIDPNIYKIEDKPFVTAEQFWGPFAQWADSVDIVVFCKSSINQMNKIGSDSIMYKKQLEAKRLYEDNALSKNGQYSLLKNGHLIICIKKEFLGLIELKID